MLENKEIKIQYSQTVENPLRKKNEPENKTVRQYSEHLNVVKQPLGNKTNTLESEI